MRIASKWIATAVAGAMALSFMAMPVMANAQTKAKDAKREKNARIGAAALGAAGIYAVSRKQTTLGVAALAGSAYEAKQMQDSVNNRHRRERAAAYRRGYAHGQTYAMNHGRYRTGSSYVWVKGRDGKWHRVKRGKAWAATRGKKKGWAKHGH